jgi:uncharacterized protein (DUF58 family)
MPSNWLHKLRLSREGLFWLLIAAAMLVTGLYKGINLITLLACWIIVLTALNGWLARRQLRALAGQRSVPELLFAQTPFRWTVKLTNNGGKPIQSVTVRDDAAGQSWFVARLPGRGSMVLEAETTLPCRGAFPWHDVCLTSGYPVGLAQATRRLEARQELLVAPRLGRLQRGVLRHWLSRHCSGLGMVRAAPHRHPAAHTEFHGLRAFRPGDSPRHIHWRTTARRGTVMVREFEDWPNDNLILLVDAWSAGSPAPAGDPLLERMLSLAATITWEWCRQKGDDFVLGIAGAAPHVCAGPTGQSLAVHALHSLARVAACPDADFAALLDRLDETPLPAAALLILTLRPGTFVEQVHARLHRAAGAVNVAQKEEADFFSLEPPPA